MGSVPQPSDWCYFPGMVEPSGRGLWMPGEFWVGDGIVHTKHGDPLATWHPVFDQQITNWKDSRSYVDARDVTPETFEHHPAKLLGPDTPFLTRMLEVTPVFALGNASSGVLRKRLPQARIYTVAFHRSADPVVVVEARGGGMRRLVSVLVPELRGSDGDEEAIDRLMRGLTDGRLSRRSLDLAEQWSGLADGPSLCLHPDDEERRRFLRMLEDQLAQAHDDATARPAACEAIELAVRGALESGVADAGDLGPIRCSRPPARTITTGDAKDPLAPAVDVDGRTALVLPTSPRWTCGRNVEAFEAPAFSAWRDDWKARRDKFAALDAERERGRRVTSLRRGLLSLVLLGVFFGFLFWLLPSRPGAACDDHVDCSSKVCRLVSDGLGYCAAPCKGLPGSCPDGSPCTWDEEIERGYCPIER